MTPIQATKKVLKEECAKLGFQLSVNKVVFKGGEDPGGWSNKAALVCIIHEDCGIPNEYNHPDFISWWEELSRSVSGLCGRTVFFESVNSCVTNLYDA
jgi:hypothetical protein